MTSRAEVLGEYCSVKLTVSSEDVNLASRRLAKEVQMMNESTLRRASRLPGWTVAHVLAHVALNAEAFVRVAAERQRGERGVMYPAGADARNMAIEDLAARPGELWTRVQLSAEAFAESWAEHIPEGPCCSTPDEPEFQVSTVLLRRLREVEVHSFDTGLDGFGFDTWSDVYVDTDLTNQWSTVIERAGVPVSFCDEAGHLWSTTPQQNPRHITKRLLLAWILNRAEIEGVEPLSTWGSQSRWRR
jgi:uncharacterized protein (TIGR03083 family)